MKLNKIDPKFISKANPRIGLIALGSDFRIEKDFNNVIYGKDIDLYVNRIHCYNPLTNETLAKMADDITEVTSDILPDQKIDCVAYGCTSGTVAAGYDVIEKNIKFGKNNASLNEVEIAAKNACLSSDINMFKDGFKTLLGERGVNLSGGQKQRLAIARAIIKRPKILILDDSLSAVDTETEEKILSNINNISKNITLIIATHRISSAKNCDKILIINNGKVLEYGSHHELIKKNGYYSKTLLKQSK